LSGKYDTWKENGYEEDYEERERGRIVNTPRSRIGAPEDFNLLHAGDEMVQAGGLAAEERVGRDDPFPSAVPDAAGDEARARELRGHRAVEKRRGVDQVEGRGLAQNPRLLAERAVGVEEPRRRDGRGAELDRQRLVFAVVDVAAAVASARNKPTSNATTRSKNAAASRRSPKLGRAAIG
jgi:hypothetical protein